MYFINTNIRIKNLTNQTQQKKIENSKPRTLDKSMIKHFTNRQEKGSYPCHQQNAERIYLWDKKLQTKYMFKRTSIDKKHADEACWKEVLKD